MFARYTYGKPVQGSVKAVVCRKHIRYNRKSSKAKRSICKDYTGKVSTWDIRSSCKREKQGQREGRILKEGVGQTSVIEAECSLLGDE